MYYWATYLDGRVDLVTGVDRSDAARNAIIKADTLGEEWRLESLKEADVEEPVMITA